MRETEEKGQSLKRVVGLGDLTALGLGAIIGTGIFVVIGEAIASSGPLIIFSFVLAGITCAFSALCCAELSSSIPVAGSAYTYAYATMGELAGWIIGWDLILEYGVSVVAVAVGWGEYLNIFLDTVFGYSLPEWIAGPPGEGGTVNLPAVFIVLAIMTLLVYGVRESARANSMMVLVKIAALLMFIVVGVTAFDGDNFSPFYGGEKEGISGVVTAASIIFFAYIGFDAISTSGEETKNAGRDLPIAILASLGVATLLYILVAVVAVGALPSDQLADSEAPLAAALRDGAGVEWGASLIAIGALVSITSVVLTIMYGQTRIFFAMCRDGLAPRKLAKVHPRYQTPILITVGFGLFIACIAAVVPLAEIVVLVNTGTLFAFLICNIAVVVPRRTRPNLQRGFRVPFVPFFPIIGAGLCIYLMIDLPGTTWWRFLIWLAIGFAIYFLYGRRHSRLQRGEVVAAEAELPEGRA
ncbi:MAG TPA: amino acid permease [Solirubrobacteraceae bacterium]|nr:amino acid permease [Solirubrobacteraceae bacterium]